MLDEQKFDEFIDVLKKYIKKYQDKNEFDKAQVILDIWEKVHEIAFRKTYKI